MNFTTAQTVREKQLNIKNLLPDIGIINVRAEIFNGLTADNKHISSKFFYDKKGSELFGHITNLPEYYLTRTEKKILENLKIDFFNSFIKLQIIEIGSGDSSKISLLLNKIPTTQHKNICYIPVDISKDAIEQSADTLLQKFPKIRIEGVVADFLHHANFAPESNNRFFCFMGSTIGNLNPDVRENFMKQVSDIMKTGELFLLGFDTIKNTEILERAYNDSRNVTAQFNLNILNVVNNLCETNFNSENFRHVAFYNREEHRIEMHLEATINCTLSSKHLSNVISIRKGERIHTENSYKFNQEIITDIAKKNHFKPIEIFSDENNFFNVALLKKI